MNNVKSWETWDWKSIKQIVFVFICLIFMFLIFFKLPDWKREYYSKEFDSVAIGGIINIEQIMDLSMSDTGNSIGVISFKIKYKYLVNSKKYIAYDNIPNSLKNKKIIDKLHSNQRLPMQIKFSKKSPYESQIILD